jgi:hypothetical protein
LPGAVASGQTCERSQHAGVVALVSVTGLTDNAVSKERKRRVAQKIQTLVIDDLDGSQAEGTVRFGLDGTEYEIDLNAGHAEALRDALARYVRAARRAGGGTRRPCSGRVCGRWV